jgi:Leucine-rich repeat (LRR) protein
VDGGEDPRISEALRRIEGCTESGARILRLQGLPIDLAAVEWHRLGHLTELYLMDLGLAEVPQGIRHLTSLDMLNLSDNELTTLPDWIGELTELTFLNVADNKLVALPDSLGDLAGLAELYVGGNHLKNYA